MLSRTAEYGLLLSPTEHNVTIRKAYCEVKDCSRPQHSCAARANTAGTFLGKIRIMQLEIHSCNDFETVKVVLGI